MSYDFKSQIFIAFLTTSAFSLNLAAFGQSGQPTAVKHAYVQKSKVVSSVHKSQPKSFWARHPMIKDATIGGGVGAGAGAVTGLLTHQGMMRGAAIGGGAGAGVGALNASQTMKRHPYAKNGAQGAIAGMGLGLASKRHEGGGRVAATTGLGAAAGLGYRYFKNNMR